MIDNSDKSDPPSRPVTSHAFSSRFGDHMLAFGMARYTRDSQPKDEQQAVWRFEIGRSCNDASLFTGFFSDRDLGEIESFCKKAREAIATDGGRKAKP